VFSQSRALIQSVTEFHESVKSDAKQLPVLLVLQSLSNEEKEEIESALDQPPDTVLVTKFNIPIHVSDLASLAPGQWLNDEIVNFCVKTIEDKARKRYFFFNSFFYSLLSVQGTGYNYSRVQKWSKKVDLLSLDKIFVPVHLGTHWCLAVIDILAKEFCYYDSLLGHNKHCLDVYKSMNFNI